MARGSAQSLALVTAHRTVDVRDGKIVRGAGSSCSTCKMPEEFSVIVELRALAIPELERTASSQKSYHPGRCDVSSLLHLPFPSLFF